MCETKWFDSTYEKQKMQRPFDPFPGEGEHIAIRFKKRMTTSQSHDMFQEMSMSCFATWWNLLKPACTEIGIYQSGSSLHSIGRY